MIQAISKFPNFRYFNFYLLDIEEMGAQQSVQSDGWTFGPEKKKPALFQIDLFGSKPKTVVNHVSNAVNSAAKTVSGTPNKTILNQASNAVSKTANTVSKTANTVTNTVTKAVSGGRTKRSKMNKKATRKSHH
jgi:hypothetical protein